MPVHQRSPQSKRDRKARERQTKKTKKSPSIQATPTTMDENSQRPFRRIINPCEACMCYQCMHVNNKEDAQICRGRAVMHCPSCYGRNPVYWCNDCNRKGEQKHEEMAESARDSSCDCRIGSNDGSDG